MQLNNWKNLFFCILLVSSGGNWCCIKGDAAESTIRNAWHPNNLSRTQVNYQQLCQRLEQEAINSLCKESSKSDPRATEAGGILPFASCRDQREQGFEPASKSEILCPAISVGLTKARLQEMPRLYCNLQPPASCLLPASDSQMRLNLVQQTPQTTQPPEKTKESEDTQKQNDPPQLESPPSNLPTSPSDSDSKEQLLNAPEINQSQRLQRLMQLLLPPKQPPKSDSDRELGLRVRLRPLEQQPPPQTEQPVVKFKPIGYLQAHLGYFQTSNIFSSKDSPTEDGLIFSGVTLASAYFPLGSKTYLNGSIDGNLIRYINQSQYDYNQVKFNLSIYQQLSQRMYGQISWSNQQLFYAKNSDRPDSFKAGDRFLNETSLELSLGRRDPLISRLTLDSFYELSVSFADPLSRNRIINSFWFSLNYYLQKPLQVGIDYQINLSDFTQRDREDQFYRLFGHLNYRISDTINMNMQAGVSSGSSTDENIDFDGWFFSVNYNLQLGRF